jgi:choline-sulfatase
LWIAAVIGAAACLALVWEFYGRRPPEQHAHQPTAGRAAEIRQPVYAPVSAPRFDRANVIVISVDTLRRDHLAPYGAAFATSAASRLAREGVVFEHAVSQVPLTLPSHASLFTGLYPPHHAIRDNGFVLQPSATTLAERFLASGYATAGFVSSYVLHSRWGIGQGHQVYDDTFDYRGLEHRSLVDVERPAEPVVDAALAWLKQPTRRARPFYLWIHLYDPHEPYAPPEAFKRAAPSAYAGEVIYADHEVNRVLDALDALNLRRDTVIVYLADHGEALGDHGEPSHGVFLYGETLDVPLILAPPARKSVAPLTEALTGRRLQGLSRLVDVMPTLLDLTGQPIPSGLDGVSLVPMIVHERSDGVPSTNDAATETSDAPATIVGPVAYAETYFPRFHYGWSELFSIGTTRWKFVRAPRPELYDLTRDPKETRDVSAQFPGIAAALRAQLDALIPASGFASPAAPQLDPEAAERLRSLGYISGNESAAQRRTGPRPDPKDKMPFLQALLRAQSLGNAGQLEQAAQQLESLARREADNPAVHLALSSVYLRRGYAQSAVATARRAVALDPESPVGILNLAFAYQAAGQIDEAAMGFQRVLSLDPGNVKALVGMAEIQYRRGMRDEAFGYYRRAAAAAPTFASIQTGLGILALELNRPGVANEALKRAVALGDTREGLHFNLGVLAEQRGDTALAAREYRAEVAAYEHAYEAWVNLGLLERQRGHLDAAIAAFERAAAAKTDAYVGPYLLAETFSRAGRIADARRWGEEALRRGPNEPRVKQLVQRLEK